jgi:hypothetical protein
MSNSYAISFYLFDLIYNELVLKFLYYYIFVIF